MAGPTNGEPVDRDMHVHTLCTADATVGLMCETPPPVTSQGGCYILQPLVDYSIVANATIMCVCM